MNLPNAVPSPEMARFIAEVAAAPRLRELGVLFAHAIARFGFNAYAAGHLSGGEQPTAIYLTTWPRAWMETYAANAFISEDPVVYEAQQRSEPFTWDDMTAFGGLNGRLGRAVRSFGFHEGFVVPVHRGEERGVVALAAGQVRMTAEERILLTEQCRVFFARAEHLFRDAPRPVVLSRRERQALSFVAQGLDDAAIAAALGVTRTSAHAYVERAKRRLGAATRAQAVATAVTEGLL